MCHFSDFDMSYVTTVTWNSKYMDVEIYILLFVIIYQVNKGVSTITLGGMTYGKKGLANLLEALKVGYFFFFLYFDRD